MIEPDDFGFNDVQTFSHIGDPVPSPDHSAFWKHWFVKLIDHTPVLRPRVTQDDSDPTATHEFVSTDDLPIGCRLVLPRHNKPVRASLVTVHGSTDPGPLKDAARRCQSVADTGVAVLIIRLRGFPGSQLGIGDQTTLDQLGAGWIGRGFASDNTDDWIVPQAIADICNACRVMRNTLLNRNTETSIQVVDQIDHPGIYLHDKSLGCGFATIAAAHVIGIINGESIIDRLVIALPSMGSWKWRLAHQHTGTAGQINNILTHHQSRYTPLIDRLRLCDAVVHGRRVRVPTLGMLARKDDVTPAPSAAAVFNAIDADPGRKWRYTVPFGHFDGGIANARRHALFENITRDFFDPNQPPIESMKKWEPLLHTGDLKGDHTHIEKSEPSK